MTAQDFVNLSVQISDFLNRSGGPLDAGTLVRSFCNENHHVRLADAEIALSLLLNKRALVVDEDLKLDRLPVAA